MRGVMQPLLFGASLLFGLLVITNIILLSGNQTLQAQINSRSQYIQQSLQLEKIYQPLVRTLAEMAATRGDEQMKTLLNEQGINFSTTPTPTAAPSPQSSDQ